jgi:hypothetical protein
LGVELEHDRTRTRRRPKEVGTLRGQDEVQECTQHAVGVEPLDRVDGRLDLRGQQRGGGLVGRSRVEQQAVELVEPMGHGRVLLEHPGREVLRVREADLFEVAGIGTHERGLALVQTSPGNEGIEPVDVRLTGPQCVEGFSEAFPEIVTGGICAGSRHRFRIEANREFVSPAGCAVAPRVRCGLLVEDFQVQ